MIHKTRFKGFLVAAIIISIVLMLAFLWQKDQQHYHDLIATQDEVPKWEADTRPLQAESKAIAQIKKINQKNDKDVVSLAKMETMIIPGLRGGWSINHQTKKSAFGVDWVPQGLTQSEEYYYISAYDGKHKLNSVIYQMNKQTKSYVKTLILPSTAHVGGITYDDEHKHLLYSDDTHGYAGFGCITEAEIDDYQASGRKAPVKMKKIDWKLGTRTSAITLFENELIVAKYGRKENERSIVTLPLDQDGLPKAIESIDYQELGRQMAKIRSSDSDEDKFIEVLIQNKFITSLNEGWDRMQGISIASSGLTVLSQSNGQDPGKLWIRFRIPEPKSWKQVKFVSPSTGAKIVKVPHAVEEVSIDSNESHLSIIFESGAKKYREKGFFLRRPTVMDRIMILPIYIESEK